MPAACQVKRDRGLAPGGHGCWGNTPCVQIMYVSPFGATALRSGSANVVLPSPPKLVPNTANRAMLPVMLSTRPSAGVPVPIPPAVRVTSPSVQLAPVPPEAGWLLVPKPWAAAAGPEVSVTPLRVAAPPELSCRSPEALIDTFVPLIATELSGLISTEACPELRLSCLPAFTATA